ncbi:MAG: pyruvate:ferredoxin (flavodoxin) oxidoreductase [Planctomycetota bacterium]|nr:MAG: pyruvate:ferredoxin (flavodoxin) oxidoreductase [Planctomycetota bacterium]
MVQDTTLTPTESERTRSGASAPKGDRAFVTIDGNEAAARVAYLASEVIAIYPITPASPMGELSDAWAAHGRRNLLGSVPSVVEMQSEGGAAGAIHGALQAGALATTFTASQGLLLMLPNMFKIAGELTPTVMHVAARTIATHALSIFGDHSDVMAARSTGWAMLASASVQEAQDLAAVAHAATLESRVPFLHFFDGFRTSHEVTKIEQLSEADLAALLPLERVREHRDRALTPDRPVLRGSAQNPDVFFQAREAANPWYDAVPGIVQRAMDQLGERTGRHYSLFDYAGAEDAERVVVVMGSGCGAVEEAVEALVARGAKVGLVTVRLYRPFDAGAFVRTLPATVRRIAVLDRTKEPGAVGEPLYQEVLAALAEAWPGADRPEVFGGRFGLSSKEFTPAMAIAVFDEVALEAPRRHFTVGIVDDVTHLSLPWDKSLELELEAREEDVIRAVFYGLGSDGTVGANKNSVKIVGEGTALYAQGYFVYDSKKAGAVTVSHLRFSPRPIRSTYLIQRAGFVACHQFHLLERMDVLGIAAPGATFLLNSPYDPADTWRHLPEDVQRAILAKDLRVFVVDATRVAEGAGLGGRINTVMQTCFFLLAGVLPREEAVARIKDSISKTYGKRGRSVLERNFAAVDASLGACHELVVPAGARADGPPMRPAILPSGAGEVPEFVERVTARILAGEGDLLPVSALPVDGTFPTGTARFEKRGIAKEIPIWDPEICIDCALCALVCPHAAIRIKPYAPEALAGAPKGFRSKDWGKTSSGQRMTIQVAPDDCTGCGICADVCPARSKEVARHKALDMEPAPPHVERERAAFDFFLGLPDVDRTTVALDTVKGSQVLEPLFEFSGACAGCGETPYLKLLTQLYGDRLLVANATGCSSIYGGNLPTTPWSQDAHGRGPAWSNSLFEDNAEFGFGMRLAVAQHRDRARELLQSFAPVIDAEVVRAILESDQRTEAGIALVRAQLPVLRDRLAELEGTEARELADLADALVAKSVWIVGGDGWAYDIGFGGLDHVLAAGRDVNVLVLDTGVYSNTGGQASKATPRAAVAKFAAGGKRGRKKDLGLLAVSYGNVYVAQIAIGANPKQTIQTLTEAASYRGPSLIIAYSHCIAHGIDMATSMSHQKEATACGFWPLYRYDPRRAREGELPFRLDSKRPRTSFESFAAKEARFAMLTRSDPETAAELFALAQRDIDDQWHLYEQMAGIERDVPEEVEL